MGIIAEELFILLVVIFIAAGCETADKPSDMTTVELSVDTLVCPQASPRLEIIYENEDFSEHKFYVDNSSDDPMKWRFTFSDTLRERTQHMRMIFQHSQDTIHNICFKLPEDHDLLWAIDKYLFSSGESSSSLKFLRQSVLEPQIFTHWKTAIYTDFLIVQTNDAELRTSIEATPGYSTFLSTKYEEGLERYVELSTKYPDSQYLIARVASSFNQYRSKEDIRKVYECFSEENKSGYWGDKISFFLDLATDHFENMALPAWDSREPEPIIKDSSKPNLVVFSASWCAPCHAMIPLLKNIHNDLGDKMDIVYVSIDEPKTADAWVKTMQNEHIPWRSLMALNKVEYIRTFYNIGGIPHQILVYPDGTMEEIEIRQEEGKEKLYDAVGK